MKRTMLLLLTCLMLLSWPQRAMAELQTAVFSLPVAVSGVWSTTWNISPGCVMP